MFFRKPRIASGITNRSSWQHCKDPLYVRVQLSEQALILESILKRGEKKITVVVQQENKQKNHLLNLLFDLDFRRGEQQGLIYQ